MHVIPEGAMRHQLRGDLKELTEGLEGEAGERRQKYRLEEGRQVDRLCTERGRRRMNAKWRLTLINVQTSHCCSYLTHTS